jgi:methyltransferase
VSLVYWVVGAVALQRIAELWLARRNTRRLLAQGAAEIAGDVYPAIVALHGAWLAAIAVFVPADTPAHWGLFGAYLAVQVARFWTMASLGRFWTTRLIDLPGAPLVRRGPYRYMRHPNYLIVQIEVALLPLVFGAWRIALGFSIFNAALLARRIWLEDRALAKR